MQNSSPEKILTDRKSKIFQASTVDVDASVKTLTGKRGFVIPLILAIVALLAVGGGVFVYQSKKVEIAKTPLVIDSNVPTVTQISTTTNIKSPSKSDAFTVIFPTTGSNLVIGKTYDIKWYGTDNEKVNKYSVYLVGGALKNNNSLFLGTAYLPAHFGAAPVFQWTVPATILPGNNYQIRFNGQDIYGGYSFPFIISSDAATNIKAEVLKNNTNNQLMDKVLGSSWRNEAKYFLALENNYLIVDQGTAPDPRGLLIYNLNTNKEIYSGSYSKPISVLNNTITYWKPVDIKVTNENCPEMAEWFKSGLGAGIESHVTLSLSDLKITELGEYRCSARQ